ncbi:MAG: alpha/beta fold hydrolase [Clostridia bacterium]|jgi:dienelactone hydrolase|nr:alpha/beta fold hydrolase [Clostridia bacterium]
MEIEKIIIGENTKYPLNGLLTLPENITEPVPAVVFVHGSGSSNMDEKVGQLTPFKDLAEGLANKGIASIRYDKRSFAHGLKMVRDKSTIITVKEETIDDAILATELLKKDSRIDSHNIFIIGHSMGGMLAPRIDSEGGKYKGLIIMAGTPRKLEDVMLEQNEAVLSSTKGLVNWIVRKQVAKLSGLFSGLYELSDEEAKKKKVMGGTTLYYFKEMGEHSVADYLATTKKTMLIVQGEKDFQVSVEKDFNEYKRLLNDKTNVEFRLYENLNHAFVNYLYSDILKAKQEYNTERHIGEEVISDIADWIMKNV